jgi:DNA gyrase subunit A
MGRPASGVIGIRMDDGDRVVAAEVVNPESDLLVISSNGYGKRTPLAEFRRQGRGGLGVTAMKTTDRNGPVAVAQVVDEQDNIMVITERGMVIRVQAWQISRIGRSTQGVGIMRVNPGDRVASLTRVQASDNGDGLITANGNEADLALASPNGLDGPEE